MILEIVSCCLIPTHSVRYEAKGRNICAHIVRRIHVKSQPEEEKTPPNQ